MGILCETNTEGNININFIENNLCFCPSCGESAGENFKGSGSDQTTFYCLKCGNIQSNRNYFHCNNCNGIFCIQCPQNINKNLASCPSCGESAGENFKGSGTTEENYYCLKCGKLDGIDDKEIKDTEIKKSFFVCFKCKSIFCYKCPYLKHEIYANCPTCGESVGEHLTGSCEIQNMQYSGIDKHTFNCLKCGKRKIDSNYYKCDKCN